MPDLDTIARIQIQATTDGVDQSTAQLDQLTAAQDRLATQSNITSATTDTSAAKQLSAEAAYQRLATRIDATYASSQAYAKGQSVLSAALNQGIIDSSTYETRLGQLGAKFGVVNEAVGQTPGIFRSLTDALGITTPAIGATAVASEAAAVAHEHHSSAAKDLREVNHTLEPALKATGASLAGVTQFTGAARGGVQLLAVALGAAFVAAAANAAEQVEITKQRLSELSGSAEGGASAFEALEKQANSLGISVDGLVKPYENLIQLVGELRQKQAGGADAATVNPAATAGISQSAIDSITNYMKADNLSAAEVAKDTSAIIAAMTSRTVSIKQLNADMTTTTEKVQALDAGGFQKIIDSSPQLANAISKAFGYASIDQFKLHLDETPVSAQKVIDVLSKLPAASKAAFDASRANGATLKDQIDALGVAWNHLLVIVGNAGVWTTVTGLVNNFAAGWEDVFSGKLPDIASKGLDLVSAKIKDWVNQASAYFAPWVASVKAMWTDWTTWASDKLTALGGTISAWVAPVAAFFATLGTGIKLEWTEWTTWASDKLAGLKSTISAWVQPVIDLFNSIGSAIKTGWGAALDWISAKLGPIASAIGNIASAVGSFLSPSPSAFSNSTSGNANYAPPGGLPPLTIADVLSAVNGADVTPNTASTVDSIKAASDAANARASEAAAARASQSADLNGLTNEDINNQLAAAAANQTGHATTASAVKAAANQIDTGLSNSTADLSAALSTGFSDISAAMDQTSVAKSGQSIAIGSAPVYQTPGGPKVLIGGGYSGAPGPGAPYPYLETSDPANINLPGYIGPPAGTPPIYGSGPFDPGQKGVAERTQAEKDFLAGIDSTNDPLAHMQTAVTATATAATATATALTAVAAAATATADALSPLYRSTSGWSGLGLGTSPQVNPNPYSTVGVPGPSYQAPGTSISGAANSNLPITSAPPAATAPVATPPATASQPTGYYQVGISSPLIPYWGAPPSNAFSVTAAGSISGGLSAPGVGIVGNGTGIGGTNILGLTPASGSGAPVGSGGGIVGTGTGYGGANTLGFTAASGIEFDVPGSAGAGDSVHLDAWVKPSEHVSVSNPSNDNGRPLPQVTQTGDTYFVTNVQTNDKRSFINSEAQLASQVARMVYAATARR